MTPENGQYDYLYYEEDYSNDYSFREPAINKTDITPLHRKVATGLLGFLAMFQIKMYKESLALGFPELNLQVCESVDYSIPALYST